MPEPITQTTLNLATTDGVSEPIEIGNRTRLSVQVIVGSAYTSSSWVAGLQWSLYLGTLAKWQSFSPAVELTPAVPGQAAVSVVGRGFVRLKTTAAEATSDPSATVVWRPLSILVVS